MKGVQSVTAEEDRTLITKISREALAVSDFTGCLLFYRKGLRLSLASQRAGHAEFRVGGEPFALRAHEGESAETVTLHLVAKDLARVQESVEAWRGRRLSGPEDAEGAEGPVRRVTYADPDGNRVVVDQPL